MKTARHTTSFSSVILARLIRNVKNKVNLHEGISRSWNRKEPIVAIRGNGRPQVSIPASEGSVSISSQQEVRSTICCMGEAFSPPQQR